jgi:hypothetical protein
VCPNAPSNANVWLGVRTSSSCLYPSCISFGFVEQGAWLDAFLPQPEHVSCWRYYFNPAAANEPPLLANSYNLTGQAGPIFHMFTHHFGDPRSCNLLGCEGAGQVAVTHTYSLPRPTLRSCHPGQNCSCLRGVRLAAGAVVRAQAFMSSSLVAFSRASVR